MTLKATMTAIINRVKKGWANALFFATLFAVLGQAIPAIYFRYFDDREYYIVRSATVVEATVKQCGTLNILFDREALQDLQAKSIVEVVLVQSNGIELEATRYARDLSIDAGITSIIGNFPLPCDIPTGVYFARGTVTYNVNGGDHITKWHTDGFTVVSNGAIKK